MLLRKKVLQSENFTASVLQKENKNIKKEKINAFNDTMVLFLVLKR